MYIISSLLLCTDFLPTKWHRFIGHPSTSGPALLPVMILTVNESHLRQCSNSKSKPDSPNLHSQGWVRHHEQSWATLLRYCKRHSWAFLQAQETLASSWVGHLAGGSFLCGGRFVLIFQLSVILTCYDSYLHLDRTKPTAYSFSPKQILHVILGQIEYWLDHLYVSCYC